MTTRLVTHAITHRIDPARGPLSPANTRVLGVRLTHAQHRALSLTAEVRRETLSTFARKALAAATGAAAPGDDPAATLADVAIALGLPAGTPGEALLEAIQELVAQANAPANVPGAATAETADPRSDLAALSAIDRGQRRELIAMLVTLGAELPATAWVGDPKHRKPAARLASQPVAALAARVRAIVGPPPPVVVLSAAERVYCEKKCLTPVEYLARKAAVVRRSGDAPAPAPVTTLAGRARPARFTVASLTSRERAECKRQGLDLEWYAARKQAVVLRHGDEPAAPLSPVATLSRAEIVACARRGIDPRDFIERKKTVVRRIAG